MAINEVKIKTKGNIAKTLLKKVPASEGGRRRKIAPPSEENRNLVIKDKKNISDLPSKARSLKRKAVVDVETEKRLKRFRPAAPRSAYKDIYDRAVTQRMYCVDRQRAPDGLSESLCIAGSTGNLYTIHIGHLPRCDCPYANKGNECKHIIFALVKVLRAPGDLYFQRAFLTSELRRIFENAPPIKSVNAAETDNTRKPIEEGDTCPICFMDFENGFEDAVYCTAACGNNIHEDCFAQWRASRARSGAAVTCPFCRSEWAKESLEIVSLTKGKKRNREGYVNVAADLGLSGRRDYSSYHTHWVRHQRRNRHRFGRDEEDDDEGP